MAFPVLPPKYYLSHFFELIDFLDQHYKAVFKPQHTNFINDFRSLSEDAQCAYVRMINRKGQIFSKKSFEKYAEIEAPSEALRELSLEGFQAPIDLENLEALTEFLTKAELRKWLTLCGVQNKISLSREGLVLIALENLERLDISKLPNREDLIVQKRVDDLRYLLFLFFGRIQDSLNLYTLRDLGIRKNHGSKTKFKPRFLSLEEAQVEFYLSEQLENWSHLNCEKDFTDLLKEVDVYKNLKFSAQNLKNQLMLQIADFWEVENPELSLSALSRCQEHPARERQCRILYKLEMREKTRELLEEMIQTPWNDEELLFAEDFLARKFEKKKIGYLTEALKNAREVTLSEAYLKKPEQGVRDLYRKQGIESHFTENQLWLGLFGVVFWEELFENEDAAIYNPFERSPADLVGSDFYFKYQDLIEAKLQKLSEIKMAELFVLKSVSLHYGKVNDVFQWHPNLLNRILIFLKTTQTHRLDHVLRMMAKNFASYHSGYPDLLVIEKGVAKFIEVKAEGDSLRAKQLSKVRLLREAGFEVEVLKVRWQTDPNQVYVVVDVETTGGFSTFHRVTEIGAVKVQGGRVIDEFQTLINPGRPIPKTITQITGITNEMVADAPSFSEVAERFDEFTSGAIFVAHNVKFDYGFIQREYHRLDQPFVRPQICTAQGMRKNFPGLASYSLKNLTQHFRISLTTHHRALCDAKAAAELLLLMNDKKGSENDGRTIIADEWVSPPSPNEFY